MTVNGRCGLLLLLVVALPVTAAPRPLQPLIDAVEPGATLSLEPGVYAGPVVIDKPFTLDGGGAATIDAGGRGTVVVVKTNGAVVQNLHLTNSGDSHNDIDAGVQVRGMFNVVKDNVIDNCLFGIDLQQAENNIVRRNHISSKPVELGMRGDAIRLWYSFSNRITDNVITDSRDTVIWYSRDNTIARNRASGGRYSLHFMYSQENVVEDNVYQDNTVGIFLMYSDGVVVRNNRVLRSVGSTGTGLGLKETSAVTVEGNEILYSATGIYLDVSPYQPDTENIFRDNLVAYNGIGVEFHSDWAGNRFLDNRFQGNLTQVAVKGARTAARNEWHGNWWDDYEGFDRDGDATGDTPYELYGYSDRIWLDVPGARFFKGAPLLAVIDFLERLAPFSPPALILRDQAPRMGSTF